MHIEFLVEELSAEAALRNLVPKILGTDISFRIHAYQGKRDLLTRLPARLRGYRSWLPEDWRIVVLLDADREDCRQLKARLEETALAAGLVTKSAAVPGSRIEVLNRLAIQELEAWFLGDVAALQTAYPRLGPRLGTQSWFRGDCRGEARLAPTPFWACGQWSAFADLLCNAYSVGEGRHPARSAQGGRFQSAE